MCRLGHSTICEGQRKAGKGAAQVYENGTGVEGLGVRGETGDMRLKMMTMEKRNRSDLVELFKISE